MTAIKINDSLFEANILKSFPNTQLGKTLYRNKIAANNYVLKNTIDLNTSREIENTASPRSFQSNDLSIN